MFENIIWVHEYFVQRESITYYFMKDAELSATVYKYNKLGSLNFKKHEMSLHFSFLFWNIKNQNRK